MTDISHIQTRLRTQTNVRKFNSEHGIRKPAHTDANLENHFDIRVHGQIFVRN